jgi:hypothetical protein
MNHMLLMLLFVAVGVAACTIDVRPWPPPRKKVVAHKKHTSHRRAASQDSMYVSPAWLTEYHEMEAEHGGYAIADDQQIKHEGDKVRVPRTVLKHFHDLSKMSPPPTESE